MIGPMSYGLPWVATGVLLWLMITVWVVRKSGGADEGIIHLLKEMDLKKIMTLRGFVMSIPAFIILGLALWSLPS